MTVNMHRLSRPLGVLLFMGPTGVGKTETVRAVAKTLLGSRDAITRIDCIEYSRVARMRQTVRFAAGIRGLQRHAAAGAESH